MAVKKKAAAHDGPKCGGKIRGGPRKGRPCTQTAGWGTDHVGSGRCKLHGGSNPIKHGRYSGIIRQRLADQLAVMEADPDPLNLRPELDLARAMARAYLEKFPTADGPQGIDLLERVANLVEKIQRQKQKAGISLETLQRVMEQLGATVARHVKDPDVLAAIEREWGSIQLGS